jgi:hypothetical protein
MDACQTRGHEYWTFSQIVVASGYTLSLASTQTQFPFNCNDAIFHLI